MQNRSIDTSFDSESYAKCIKFTSHYTHTHTQVNLVLPHTHVGPNLIPATPPPQTCSGSENPEYEVDTGQPRKGWIGV